MSRGMFSVLHPTTEHQRVGAVQEARRRETAAGWFDTCSTAAAVRDGS